MTGPNFLIVGAQKCGTTNLWHVLDQHPLIEMHPRKELHYFLRYTNYPDHEWYIKQFEFGSNSLKGEATPSYCFWPGALDRIKEFNPLIKLVMILRDPVQRAISQYWMEFNGNHEGMLIEAALVPLEEREATYNARGIQLSLYHHSYLWRGLYYSQLKRMYTLFSESQIHILRLEDYRNDPEGIMAEVAKFLGVDPEWDFQPHHARRKGSYNPPTPELLDRLSDFYRTPNKLLTTHYSIETGDWR